MKKIYLLAVICTIFSMPVVAQQLLEKPLASRKCATAELLQQYINTHPNAETTQQFEAWMSQKVAEVRANRIAGKVNPGVVVPVVFHIVHNSEAVGSGRNISQAAVQQQVLQINKDYANLSNSPYGAVAEDMGIRFALAQNDPTGVALAEPGIDRIDRSAKGWSAPPYTVGYASSSNYLTNTIKPNSIWDPARYLNIWVSQWEAGILGIATFPTSSGLPGLGSGETNLTAGVTIDYTTVGSIFAPVGSCASAYGKGKTLTHELGHFFGLRHIWGDANCGTDYCNDTPTHFADNSGTPQHPKANSCGTADEMFENYMDYCDDIVANTFTVNQGDRMEAVFANSPRRGSLTTSNVGLVFVTASNRIAFADCDGAFRVSESSTMTTCPKYTDVSLLLNVEDKATAATTVIINTGGTAVIGVDYDLLTPTLNFAAGDNYKPVIIRIFDNGVAGANKTINLSYSIGSGGGVSAGTLGQSIVVTIVDDDVIKPVNNSSSGSAAFSENFGTTANSGSMPAGWVSGTFSTSANIFTVNAVYGDATGFTAADGRVLHVTNGTARERTNETAPNTYTFDPTETVPTPSSNAIALTKSINTVGYKNLKLTFDYAALGEADAQGDYDYGSIYYSTTAQTSGLAQLADAFGNPVVLKGKSAKTAFTLNLPASFENLPNLWFGFGWTNDDNSGANPPLIVDNIVVSGDFGVGVSTNTGEIAATSLGTGQSTQFISAANKIIATLSNPNYNVGCVTGSISSSGNGQAAVTTNVGGFLRSNKVISITPAAANTTATYTATFYFTTAELAVWGTDVPNLKLMKVKDAVDLGSVLTGNNTLIVNAVVDDQRATKGYASFTGNFTGGFSQFMLASPLAALPVSLISFDATPQGKAIRLNWSTSNEINNKAFIIERSSDATHFEDIGNVPAAMASAGNKNYLFTDYAVQANVLYYYRLRQIDADNKAAISEVRQARIKTGALSILVSPNPAKNTVTVHAPGSNAARTQVKLLDASGAVVQQWNKLNIASAPAVLNIKNVGAGVYMLQVIQDNEVTVEKLIIN